LCEDDRPRDLSPEDETDRKSESDLDRGPPASTVSDARGSAHAVACERVSEYL